MIVFEAAPPNIGGVTWNRTGGKDAAGQFPRKHKQQILKNDSHRSQGCFSSSLFKPLCCWRVIRFDVLLPVHNCPKNDAGCCPACTQSPYPDLHSPRCGRYFFSICGFCTASVRINSLTAPRLEPCSVPPQEAQLSVKRQAHWIKCRSL